jgi:hypothetical protein
MKMSEQNFVEHVNTSDVVGQTNRPLENSDSFDDQSPVVDAVILNEAPMEKVITHEAPIDSNPESSALFNHVESEHFRTRWSQIQGGFVDEPRSSVQQADALVSEVIEKIAQMFASEHSSLESQWNQGSEVSTEELRKALQHYRSFFNRLVLKNEE